MKLTGALCLAALVVSVPSCEVDELYSSENIQSADTEMTLFQNGLEIPLGSTAKLRVDSILKATGLMTDSLSKYLKVTEDGSYLIQYADTYVLDSTLASLGLSDLDIDGVSVSENFSFEVGEINADDLKVAAKEFGKEVIVDDLTEDLNSLKIDPINESISEKAGIAGVSYDFAINFQPVSTNNTLLTKSTMTSLAAVMPNSEFSIPSEYTPMVELPNKTITVDPVTLPSQIKKLNEVVLKSSAKIRVAISVENCILVDGQIYPNGKINLGGLITVGGASEIDLADFTIKKDNNFTATKDYAVTSVNAAKLSQSNEISVYGTASIGYATASKEYIAEMAGDMKLKVEVSFIDCELDHVVCEINPYNFNTNKDIDITVDPVELPEQVKSVKNVTFDAGSNLVLTVQAKNAANVTGLGAHANITVEFPASMHVSGEGISAGKLIVNNADITVPVTRTIHLDSIDLPAPTDGKVGYSAVIKTSAEAVADGTVNSKDIPATAADDIELVASFTGNINVADYAVRINPISEEVEVGPEIIHFDLTDAVGDFGSFTVIPKGSPKLRLDIVIPDTGGLDISTGDGIVVSLPDMVVFSSVPSALNYNATAHSITIKDLVTASYDLPIEKLIITPTKDSEGKYVAESEYGVHGTISIPESDVNKTTAEKLSGAKFRVVATIPEIAAESIQMETLSFDVSESQTFELLDASTLPEQLISISDIELDGNFIDLAIELNGLPDIGTGKYMTDLTVKLPEFIDPKQIVINQEIVDGKLNVHQALNKLDLSGFDFPTLRAEGKAITDSIVIKGKVYADNPSVDLATISQTVTGKVDAKVGDANAKISIKSVTGKVDYNIDFETGIALAELLGGLDQLEGLTLDLPLVSAKLDITSDLSLPLDAKAVISAEGITPTEIVVLFPFSTDGNLVTKNNAFDLDLNPYVQAKPIPDSLKFAINGKVDKTKDTYLELDKEYHATVDYSLELPIQLGENFKVESCDTISLGEAGQYIGQASVGLRGSVESTLPLGVELELQLLSKNETTGIYTMVPMKNESKLDIAPNATTPVQIDIIPAVSENAPKVTDLRLKFSITSNGEALNENDFLQAKLSAVIPEGITIDPFKK